GGEAARRGSEGGDKGYVVGKCATSTGPGGEGVLYVLKTDSSNGGFKIDSTTGVVSVADKTKLTLEAGGTYSITVQANEGDEPARSEARRVGKYCTTRNGADRRPSSKSEATADA